MNELSPRQCQLIRLLSKQCTRHFSLKTIKELLLNDIRTGNNIGYLILISGGITEVRELTEDLEFLVSKKILSHEQQSYYLIKKDLSAKEMASEFLNNPKSNITLWDIKRKTFFEKIKAFFS
jgi:hypothetical protein